MQIACEVQMFLDCFPFGQRQSAKISRRLNGHREARGAEKIAHPFRPPDHHSGRWIGRHPNQYSMGVGRFIGPIAVPEPLLHFMRRVPKREFPQSDEGRFPEKILQGLLRLLSFIHHASFQAV
jgi:hypothetical protein